MNKVRFNSFKTTASVVMALVLMINLCGLNRLNVYAEDPLCPANSIPTLKINDFDEVPMNYDDEGKLDSAKHDVSWVIPMSDENEQGEQQWKIIYNLRGLNGSLQPSWYKSKSRFNLSLSSDLRVKGDFHIEVKSRAEAKEGSPQTVIGAGTTSSTTNNLGTLFSFNNGGYEESIDTFEARLGYEPGTWEYNHMMDYAQHTPEMHYDWLNKGGSINDFINDMGAVYSFRYYTPGGNDANHGKNAIIELNFTTVRDKGALLKQIERGNVEPQTYVLAGYKNYDWGTTDVRADMFRFKYDKDTDGDGLTDLYEIYIKSNPCDKDTDKDGVEDGAEIINKVPKETGDGVKKIDGSDPVVGPAEESKEKFTGLKDEIITGKTHPNTTVAVWAYDKLGNPLWPIAETVSDAEGNYKLVVGQLFSRGTEINKYGNNVELVSTEPIVPKYVDNDNYTKLEKDKHEIKLNFWSDGFDGRPLFTKPEMSKPKPIVKLNDKYNDSYVMPDDNKTVVDDPNHLTPKEKEDLINNLKDNDPNFKNAVDKGEITDITVDDKGNVNITYKDDSTSVIPGENVTKTLEPSEAGVIDPVIEGDETIKITAPTGSEVAVALPGGKTVTAVEDPAQPGKFVATVPTDVALTPGAKVIATVTEAGKKPTPSEVTVTEKAFDPTQVTGIEVVTPPTKTDYTEGETLDASGLKVKLTDANGKTKEVDYADLADNNITLEPNDGAALTPANTELKVKHGDKEATTPLTVTEKAFDPTQVTGIEVVTPPTKTNYLEGESFDVVGLKVKLTDANGKTKLVGANDLEANGITLSINDGDKVALTNDYLVVSHGANSATVAIKVYEAPEVTYAQSLNIYPQNFKVTQNATAVAENGISVPPDKLPAGTTVTFYSEPDTSVLGDQGVDILVSYPDGSSTHVNPTMTVVADGESTDSKVLVVDENLYYNLIAKPIVTEKGKVPSAELGLANLSHLPAGIVVKFADEDQVNAAVANAGEYDVSIIVTFPADSTTGTISTKLIVNEGPTMADVNTPKFKDVTVNQGDALNPEDAVSNLDELPTGTEVTVTNASDIDTSKPGTYTAEIKVTYPDGSSTTHDVVVKVEDSTIAPTQPSGTTTVPSGTSNVTSTTSNTTTVATTTVTNALTPSASDSNTTTTNRGSDTVSIPRTGEYWSIIPLIILLIVAAGAIIVRVRKKN